MQRCYRRAALVRLLPCVCVLVASVGCGAPRSPAPQPEGGPIELTGLAPAQAEAVREALDGIEALRAVEPRIDGATYARLSRFEALFGFPFDGAALARWIRRHVRRVESGDAWTAAVADGDGVLRMHPSLLERPLLDRMYVLVHEARHLAGGPGHVDCPADLPFVSAAQPDQPLAGAPGCDRGADGAYGFQAAFLFELYARGLVDPERAGLLYNSTIARILGTPAQR
jgi:hypothetical protein